MQSAMARSFFRRIAVFLGALFAVFVAALVALGLVEGRLRRAIVAEETAEQGRRFDGAFRLAGAPLAMFTEAYGRRVSFTRPRAVLDAASPRTVLAAGVRTFGADFAWVVEADDTLRYHAARDGQTQMPLPPLPPVAVREPRLHYFFVHEGVLHELRGRRIDADRRSPEDVQANAEAARYPYLGPGFEFVEKVPGRTPHMGDIHLFNWGSILSHGALAGDIPGLFVGATRLVQAISHALFREDAERHFQNMVAQEDPELAPTDYFVPRDKRSGTL